MIISAGSAIVWLLLLLASVATPLLRMAAWLLALEVALRVELLLLVAAHVALLLLPRLLLHVVRVVGSLAVVVAAHVRLLGGALPLLRSALVAPRVVVVRLLIVVLHVGNL